ncbi:MAG: hypothetical protein FI695_02795 [SAR202 cluster bacterium]|nr:hypothetical protein [Chloroflexota bacterium]MQG50888.1 hypothetical protein [SAR202 cluster bacterium]
MMQNNFTIDNNLDFSNLDLSEKSNVINRYLDRIFKGNICNSILTLDVFYQDDTHSSSFLYDYMMIADAVISYIEKEKNKFSLVYKPDCLAQFEDNSNAIILAYSNPALLSSRPEILRQMYRLGFRAITLKNNPDSDEYNPDVINQDLIQEANLLSMIINCNGFDKSLFDLLIDSKLIISNIGSYSICPNPGNIPDSDLIKVKERGNIVSLSLDDFYISKHYFEEVTKLQQIAEWEIKYLEVEYSFDSPELKLKKQQIYQKLNKQINDIKSLDISFDDLINHISHINKIIGLDNIHLASGLGGFILDEGVKYNDVYEITAILIQKLKLAGFDNEIVENMFIGNMLNFMARKKH